MGCVGNSSDINQLFIIEPLSITGGSPTLSACTTLYTNNITSCSGNTQILMGTNVITFSGDVLVNTVSATTIYADLYYSGGTLLRTGIINIITGQTVGVFLELTGGTLTGPLIGTTISANAITGTTISATTYNNLPLDIRVTGGTFNNSTDSLTFTNNTGGTFNVTGLTDYYTTGATLIGSIVYFNRTDAMSAYTLNLGGLDSFDNFITGASFSNNNLILTNNTGGTITVLINNFSGLTVNGTLSATTILTPSISATTYNNLPLDIRVTGGTPDNAAKNYTFTNNTGGTFVVNALLDISTTAFTYSNNQFNIINNTGGTLSVLVNTMTGLTVNGTLSGITILSNSISATTYNNLPLDIRVTGGTYSNGTTIFTNNTGGTFSVTGLFTGGTDVFVTGGTPNNAAKNYTFTNNTGGTFSVDSILDINTTAFTYSNNQFNIINNTGGTLSVLVNTMTGLTVNGSLSAITLNTTTISATTYQNLPLDIRVTGGTYSNPIGTLTLTNNTGGTFTVTGFFSGGTDVFVTGGTPNNAAKNYTFTNNTGGTFVVNSILDINTTAFTYSNNLYTITNNTGGTLSVLVNTMTGLTINGTISATTISATSVSATTYNNLPLDIRVTGGTYSNGTAVFMNNTGGTFSVSGFSTGGTGTVNFDVYVTGGTYTSGTAVFTNNTGGTFSVSGFSTGGTGTDTFVTGFTYSNNLYTIKQNQGQADLSILVNTMTGLTVNGSLSAITLNASTISATTYNNLPIDVRVTGGTYSNGTATYTNNTGGTFNVTGFFTSANDIYSTGITLNPSTFLLTINRNDGNSFSTSLASLASDVNVTGGTYNQNTGVVTFYNNSGGTFQVSGFTTGLTDTRVTSFTYNNANQLTIIDSTGGTFTAQINIMSGLTINGVLSATTISATSVSATTYNNLPLDIRVTGGTYSNGTATFMNNTGGTFTVSGLYSGSTDVFVTGGTPNNAAKNYVFTNNTGGTFTVDSILDISTTAFTYSNNLYTITNNTGGTLSVLVNTMSGLTVNGVLSATTISATSISATTYNNLPLDIRVTGGTYSNPTGTATFTNNTGGTFSVTGFFSGGTDVYVTGGTPNNAAKNYTFTNNTGGTFVVNSILDINTTAFTYNNNQFNIINNTGGTLSVLVNTMTGLTVNGTLSGITILSNSISATTYNNLPLDIRVTGGTYSNPTGTLTFTNNTGGTFSVNGLFSGGTDVFVTGGTPDNAARNYTFTNNTGGTFVVNALLDINTTAFTYSNNQFNIINNTGGTLSVLVNTMTGLTVNGTLSGITILSNSISATTYNNLPLDIRVTGGTYNNPTGTLTFTNNTGGTFNVNGLFSGNTEIYVTGGTPDNAAKNYVFTNNTGGTFVVNSILDINTTAFTYSNNQFNIINNTGGTLSVLVNTMTGLTVNGTLSAITLNASTISATTYNNLPIDVYVTGGTYSNPTGTLTFKNNTGGTFTVNGFFTGGTDVFVTGGTPDNAARNYTFTNNTGGTFTVNSILDINTTAFTYSNNTYTLTNTTGGTLNLLVNTMSGLTVNGTLSGITILSNSISATTYQNLPIDVYVTGGAPDNSNRLYTFTNNTGGTFTVNGLTDVRLTGGTYNNSNGSIIFRNNTGGTFNVTGLFTGGTDVFVTSGSYDNPTGTATFTNNTGGTFSVTGFFSGGTDVYVTGGTYSNGTATFMNNTGGTFNVTGFSTGGGGNGASVTAFTYSNNLFTIHDSSGFTYSVLANTMTGLTVNGTLSGITILSNSISATTYNNLPLDIRVTGGTPDNAARNYTFTNNTGGTFTVNSILDISSTAFTYSNNQFNIINNTGGTLSVLVNTMTGLTVNGVLSAITLNTSTISATTYQNLPIDVYVTGGTYSSGSATFINNTGGTFTVSGFNVGGGGGQVFYLNLSQSQNGNRLLSTTASTASEQTSGVTIANGVTSTIASFQSQPLNITLLPGGVWSFYLHSYKENNNATFNIFVEVYKRTSGGTETLLFATDPTAVTTNSPNPSMQLSDGYFSGTSLNVSDSVVARVTATNTGNQSHIITLVTEGSTHYSYVVSTIPTQQGLTCDTLSGCSIIQTIQTDISNKFDKSGGTVNGATNFTNGLSATTISATTYYNLPTDVFVTGGTYSSGSATFTNNTGGTFTVTGLFTGSTLQQAYNNSTTPEIVTNSTLGSLSINNGTGNADNITKLLQGINTGGTETSFIRADGGISGTTLTATTITATSITATTHYGAWSGAILPTTITEAKIKGTASNSYVAFGAGVLDTLDASANFTYDKNNLRLLVGSAAGTYSAGHTIYNNSNTFDIFIERTSATGIAGIGLMAGTSLFQIYKLGQSAAGVFQTSTVPNASLAQFVSGTYNQNFALHGSNIYMFTSLASNSFAVGFTSGGTLFGNMENMGTVASAPVHIMKTGTTDQQRIGYNSTNYYTTTVSSAGTVTYDAVGASAGFRFNDSISATTYLGLPTDVYVTGFTYSNNTFTINNNTGGTLNLLVNTMSGLTVNGTLSATTISAVTISATTISAVTVTANNIIRNWTSTSAISTINSGINEVLWVQKIPAGTVKVGDYLDFYNVFAMTNSANAKNIRVYIGTSADTVTCATTATNQIAFVGAFGSGTASSSFARRLGVRSMTRLIGWLDGTTSYGGDAGTTSITNTAITVPNFSADTYYIVTGNRASGSELLRLDFAKLSIVPTLN